MSAVSVRLGRHASPSQDVYSFGAVIVAVLTELCTTGVLYRIP